MKKILIGLNEQTRISTDNAINSSNKLIKYITLGLSLALIFFVFNPIVIVNAGYVGMLLEFGKTKEVLQPGVKLIIPIVHSVKLQSTQINKYEATASAASKDLQGVTTTIAVNHRPVDSDESLIILFNRFRGNYEDRIINPTTQEVVKAVTAQYTAEELITKRSILKTQIATSMKKTLLEYGIVVTTVSITNFQFSKEFDNAIEAKVTAEQNMLKEKYDLQKKQIEVQKQIAVANATKISNILVAEGKAQATILEANAQAQAIKNITSELKSNSDYVKYYYVSQWNGELPKYLGTNDLFLMLNENSSYGE